MIIYSNTEVHIDTIIQIENNTTNFQLDDTIYISTILNNEQVSINDITVYLTDFINQDSPDNLYYYYLNLYKETAYGTYALIELNTDALEVIEGEITVDYQSLFVRCDFNNAVYNNKFGIKLLEPGTYYLSGSQNYYNQNTQTVSLFTNNYGSQNISVYSRIINLDVSGRYYFPVN